MADRSIWDALEQSVARMGTSTRVPIDFSLAPADLPRLDDALRQGIEIDIDELDDSRAHGGLLGYQGAQILLYIRDQTPRDLDAVLRDSSIGKRYHVAHCSTLRKMKRQNRFERYVATNDVSGEFDLRDGDHRGARTARGALDVCKNCLRFLNYRAYRTDSTNVFLGFGLPAFFATYSTLFDHMPMRSTIAPEGAGEQSVPAPVSDVHCGKVEFECARCHADFADEASLLSAVRSTQNASNGEGVLIALCLDCRRKAPRSEPIVVSRPQMTSIVRRRRAAVVTPSALTWKQARALADSAYLGLLDIYERQGYAPPEPGLDLTDGTGAVVVTIGLAWPESEEGVVLTQDEQRLAVVAGWPRVMHLEEALLDSGQDG